MQSSKPRSLVTVLPWVLAAVVLLIVLLFPLLTSRPRFWLPNIGIRSIWLGIIAMSVVFLNRYVGLLSLAQVAIAGASAYGLGYFVVQMGTSFWVGAAVGVMIGTAAAFLMAIVTVRTKSIYFLMITLALSQVLFSWAGQAIEITNARRGLAPIGRPNFLWFDLNDLTTFYYFAVGVAIACLLLCLYMGRSNFGLTLQGIRDSPQRMEALGYSINRYRTLAVTFAGFIAAIGGVLMAMDRAQIDPDAVSLSATLDVLIVAVIGGISSLVGVFLGGIVLTLLTNFGQNFTEFYVSVMGVVFILILYFAPSGIAGLGQRIVRILDRRRPPHREGTANKEGIQR